MNILCITSSPNLGMYRLMKILNSRGYNIFLLYHGKDYKTGYGLDMGLFRNIYQFPNNLYYPLWPYFKIKQSKLLIYRLIINHKIDLIYSVNIYNDLLSFIASSLHVVPVIYNMVDMHSLISNSINIKNPIRSLFRIYNKWNVNYLEKQSHKLSSGYIFSTEYMQQLAVKKYRINLLKSTVLSNYLPRDAIALQGQSKLSAIDNNLHFVYEGIIGMTGWGYILPTILKIAKRNIHIHLYCSKIPNYYLKEIGDNSYVHWEKFVSPDNLTYELSKYDYGLMAYDDSSEKKHLDSVLPNKLFDYLAAGLPVLSPSFKSIKYFIEKYDVGVVFENIDQLMKSISEVNYLKLVNNVIGIRTDLTIENRIDNIIKLFDHVISTKF